MGNEMEFRKAKMDALLAGMSLLAYLNIDVIYMAIWNWYVCLQKKKQWMQNR